MKLAVTGARGYVARNLRRSLAAGGHGIISISRGSPAPLRGERCITSGLGAKQLARKLAGCDALYHLAGAGRQDATSTYRDVNYALAQGAVQLCKAARIPRIIYLSGLGVSPRSTSGYFISKKKAEDAIISSGIDYVVFRPSYIVGRGDHLTRLLRRRARSGTAAVPGSGKYTIQPIHVDDAVGILERAAAGPRFRNKTLDLVGPRQVQFGRYARAVTGARHKKEDLEGLYRRALGDPRTSYGLDDLNILVGSFGGDHRRLCRVSKAGFGATAAMLKAGGLG